MSAPDSDRARDFAAFEAETRLRLAHLSEMYQRLLPIHEARSGDKAEMGALQRDVSTIKSDVESMDEKVDKLTDAQRRMFAIFLAVQVLATMVMWGLSSGFLKWGGPP